MKKLVTAFILCLCAAISAIAQEKIKIACIGDSITEGFGLKLLYRLISRDFGLYAWRQI